MVMPLLCATAMSFCAPVEDLPLIDPGVTVYQTSSHNKMGLNGDGGFWLYDEESGEKGLVGWQVIDDGAAAEYTEERVYSGVGALRHRIALQGLGTGWRSLAKPLTAGLNVSDCDAVTMRVWPTYADGGADYGIRIDSGGHNTELTISDLTPGQWNDVTVDISEVPREGVGMFWLLFNLEWGGEDGMEFYVDDIAFRRPDGSTLTIDDFESGPDWYVVLDALGPGCVKNMWGLGGGDIRIEADGEVIAEGSQTDLYEGRLPGFASPLVCAHVVSSAAWIATAHWSFAPIPFRERCRILVKNTSPFNHYIYERYRDPSRASQTVAAAHRREITRAWSAIGEDPKRWSYTDRAEGQVSLAPGDGADLTDIAGAGAIGEIRFGIAPTSPEILDGVRLRIWWDGEPTPSVDAPIGVFFGAGVKWAKVPSLVVGTDGDTGYCYLPMPFWKRARVRIENTSDVRLERLDWSVGWSEQQVYPRERTGYFRTWFHHDPDTEIGRDYTFLRVPGRGQFVGVVQTLIGGHYCEGDIRFYCDGSRSPQLYGTGSEDYYHCACWPNKDNHTPFHGCVGDVAEEAAALGVSFYDLRACYYRFHLDAPIRFENGIRAGIEHGGVNDTHSNYTSLAYYYSQDAPGLRCTDTVTPTADANGGEPREVTGFFEGDDDDVEWTFAGVASRGALTATLRIDPQNKGVRLRRVLDQSIGRQWATVYVDGRKAGDWYDADTNEHMRLAESDFEVPADLTAGKHTIAVEFRPAPDGPEWTLLELSALCYLDGLRPEPEERVRLTPTERW